MKSQRNYFVRNASALLGASPLLLNTMRTGAISALLACVGPFELFARSDGLFVVVGLSNGTLRWLDCWLAAWLLGCALVIASVISSMALYWLAGAFLVFPGEEKLHSHVLSIENVDRHKGGVYICTANNGVGQPASSQVVLHVLCKYSTLLCSCLRVCLRMPVLPIWGKGNQINFNPIARHFNLFENWF